MSRFEPHRRTPPGSKSSEPAPSEPPLPSRFRESGIDYSALRRLVSIRDVLNLIHWREVTRRGPQLRGPCPVHRSESPKSRSLSVNLERNVFHCFKAGCEAKGNAIDLFVLVTGKPLYEAAIDLCQRLGIEPPRKSSSGTEKRTRP